MLINLKTWLTWYSNINQVNWIKNDWIKLNFNYNKIVLKLGIRYNEINELIYSITYYTNTLAMLL